MVDFWAVIGLSTIDEKFYHLIVDNLDNPDTVASNIASYNFRLSRYEIGEVIRIYRKAGVRAGIEAVQLDSWEHFDTGDDTPCWTGAAISGLNKPEAGKFYLHGYFEEVGEGKGGLVYSPLSAIPNEESPEK